MALNCDFASVRLLLPGSGAHPMGAVSMGGGLAARFAGAVARRDCPVQSKVARALSSELGFAE